MRNIIFLELISFNNRNIDKNLVELREGYKRNLKL